VVQDVTRRGFFDKLHQGFDVISKLYTCHHDSTLLMLLRISLRYDERGRDQRVSE
jgi:hypothetical protein